MKIKSRVAFLVQAGRYPNETETQDIEAGEAVLDAKLNDHVHYIFTVMILLGFIGFSAWGLHAQKISEVIWGAACLVAAMSCWAYDERVKSFLSWLLPKLTSSYDYLGKA